MQSLNFPLANTIGETFTQNDRTWEWNGTSWVSFAYSAGYTGSIGYTGSSGLFDGEPSIKPILSNFTWLNQGSATATQRDWGISLSNPPSTTDNLRMLYVSTPSTPYTVTMRFKAFLLRQNFYACGFFWRESSSGKIQTADLGTNSTTNALNIAITNWNSATSFNSSVISFSLMDWVEWMRIIDDGTNRIAQISMNGYDWSTYYSAARTTFITPDQLGFFINVFGGYSGINHQMSILSWSIT